MRTRLILPLLASLLILGLLFSVRLHRSESVESCEVELSTGYFKALSLLGRKSSLEDVLSADGADLLDSRWEEFDLDTRRAFRPSSWELQARGRFRVLSKADVVGGEMEVFQTVCANEGGITVKSRLLCPSGFLKVCTTETTLSNSRPVVVRVESRVVYERYLPFWVFEGVDARVSKYNSSRVSSVAKSIKRIVDGG